MTERDKKNENELIVEEIASVGTNGDILRNVNISLSRCSYLTVF